MEEFVGSIQTYEHTLPQSKKEQSIVLNSVNNKAYEFSNENFIEDNDIALLVRKFKKSLGNVCL